MSKEGKRNKWPHQENLKRLALPEVRKRKLFHTETGLSSVLFITAVYYLATTGQQYSYEEKRQRYVNNFFPLRKGLKILYLKG